MGKVKAENGASNRKGSITVTPRQLAQQRIEQVRQNGFIILDLAQLGLKEVPEETFELTNLQELNLSNNELTALPESIFQLTNLRRLFVSGNQLTTVSQGISQLANLQEVILSDNQLTTVPEGIFSLKKLRFLDLYSNQLKAIPEKISHLTNLQILDLGNNQLTELPEGIASLINLTDFYLGDPKRGGGNFLGKIPECVRHLTQLERLDLSNNQLTDLPLSLGRLSNLTELILENNPLNSDLATAYKEGGPKTVLQYLRRVKHDLTKQGHANFLQQMRVNEQRTYVAAAFMIMFYFSERVFLKRSSAADLARKASEYSEALFQTLKDKNAAPQNK